MNTNNSITHALFALTVVFASIGRVSADSGDPVKLVFVAAFPIDESRASPGTLVFSERDGKKELTLTKGDLHVTMKVQTKRLSDPFSTVQSKSFDAVYTSDDGLLSVIVTGTIGGDPFNSNDAFAAGSGQLAIHHAASATNQFKGNISIQKFNIEQLHAEQAGTGRPAARPESKSEVSDKPQPAAEGRSR